MNAHVMNRRHFFKAVSTAGAAAAIASGTAQAFAAERAADVTAVGDADVNFTQTQ